MTSVNISYLHWTLLTLIEVQEFQYRVTTSPLNDHSGQSQSRSVVIRESYSVITNLISNTFSSSGSENWSIDFIHEQYWYYLGLRRLCQHNFGHNR